MNYYFRIFIIFFLLLFAFCSNTIDLGLVSYQPFSGDYSDQSGNSNQCKNYGAKLAADRFGNPNSAYSFNGIFDVKNQMICPISESTFQNDWSISAWIYHRNSQPKLFNGIVSNAIGQNSIIGSPVLTIYNYSNQIGWQSDQFTTGTFTDLSIDHYSNWVFSTITLNFSERNLSFYTNYFNNGSNFSMSSSAIEWESNINPTILIGTLFIEDQFFEGIIDEVRIYNRSLTINEVWSLYCFPFNYAYENNVQKCLTNCSAGYFMNLNNTCSLCNSSCKTCNISENRCTSCFYDYGLLNGECLSSCPHGFDLINSLCVFSISGLVSQYPFNEGLKDLSGNGNDCQNAGIKDALLSIDRFGNTRNALDFDGEQTFLKCPITPSALSNDWTITAWFKHRLSTDQGTIFSNNFNSNPNAPIITLMHFTNWIGQYHDQGNVVSMELSPDHFHKWSFIALRKLGQEITLFVNEFDTGNRIWNTTSLAVQLSWNPDILIGNFWTHQLNVFDGLIDDVFIFNRGLTNSEIFSLYCVPNTLIQENNDQRCINSCNEGYFMNQSQCAKCNNSCKTCNVSANKCTSCNVNSGLYMGECLSNCPYGFSNVNSQCVFQIEGLAAQYPFNGDTLDQSGNNQDCVNNGALLSPDRFGNPRSSFVFDGVKDYMKCLMMPSHIAGDWTINAWIKHRSVTNQGAILSNNVDQIKEGPGLAFFEDTNSIGIARFGISGSNVVNTLPNDHFNKWTFVSIRQESNTVDICLINEVSCNIGVIEWALKTSPINWIAKMWDIQSPQFDGFIDDITIFNKKITDNEVWASFCQPFHTIFVGLRYVCITTCQQGQYMNKTNQCAPCNSSCLTCNLTADSCTSCPQDRIYFIQKCLLDCPIGFTNISNKCDPAISGLISYYPFAGDANDLSENMNDCVNYNAELTKDRFGNPNRAYSFDGQKSYIHCPINPTSLMQDWTITAWINHKGVTDYGTIISNNVGVKKAILLSMISKFNIIGMYDSEINNNEVNSELGPDHFFKWIFVSIQKKNSNLNINWIQFANGNSQYLTGPLNFVTNQSPSILIGMLVNNGLSRKAFQGDIDDIRIYNRSLEQYEIFSLYCFPWPVDPSSNTCKNCSEQFFMNGSICSSCNSSCKSCNFTENNCLSCSSPLFLHEGKCVLKCPKGFAGVDSKCVSPNNYLRAYQPFDNDLSDHSGNNENDCINYGAIPAIDRFKNSNAALSFDGESSYLLCSIPINSFEFDWTITAWIYHRTMTNFAGIVSNNNLERQENPIITIYKETTKIGINDIGNNNENGVFIDFGNEHQNKWAFIAVTRQGNSLAVHGNIMGGGSDLLNASMTLNWDIGSKPYLEIGRNWNFSVFDGIIDEVRIYNTCLNDQELFVLQNYTCIPGLYQFKNNSSCLEQCPEGYFIQGGDCTICHQNCSACYLNETNCTRCKEGQGFQKWKCLLQCPDGFINNQSICISKINGLVSYQTFQNDHKDQSGNNNDCYNLGATLTIDRFNNSGGAFMFNGSKDNNTQLKCPIKASSFENDWTISCWINQLSLIERSGIVTNNWQIDDGPGIQQKEMENKIGMKTNFSEIWLDLGANTLNKWLFLVLKKESSKIKIYSFIKGERLAQTEESLNGTQRKGNYLLIGRTKVFMGTIKEIFNGSIDDVRIFNLSISEDEVFQLFCFPNMFYFPANVSCLKNCATEEGFYINGTQCVPCNSSCKLCDFSSNNCTQCFANFGLVNFSCQKPCPEGQQMEENLCKLCNLAMCKTCNISSSWCLSCQDGEYLYNNTCLGNCPEGWFIENKSECIKCHASCKTCNISSSWCLSCQDGEYWYNNTCLGNCPEGQFIDNKSECLKCHSACKTCNISSSWCLSCIDGTFLYNNTCIGNCPVGQFIDNKSECIQCHSSCKTCNISSSQCLSCIDGTFLYNNTCIGICPVGQFIDNKSECIKCHSACKTCLNSFNQCTSCPTNFILDSLSNCIVNCPTSFSFYNNDTKQCEACRDINCEICSRSAKVCTKCKKGYTLTWEDKESNICERPFCLTNEYRFNSTCFPCPEHCKTCILEKMCLSCQISYGLAKFSDDFWACAFCSSNETWINGLCLSSCLPDEYLNTSSNRCEKCVSPCQQCLNKTACSSCIIKNYLTESKECIDKCPESSVIDIVNNSAYCSKCQIKNCNKCATIIECKECTNATYLQSGKCIAQCPSSMPANSQNKCSSSGLSNDSQEEIAAIKDEFTQSLLSIFSADESINSLDLDNLVLSQDTSSSIIDSFVKMTDESASNLIDDLMSNSVVGSIIQSAVKNSLTALSNFSIEDIFDNKEKIQSLCEATKLSALSNYSAKCMEIAGNMKNEKMTLEQTKSILGIIILSAKPRTIKEKANNSSKIAISQEDLYSTSQKTNLLDILNSASNSLCIRNAKNLNSINQTENNVQFLFQNITVSPTIVRLNYSTISVNVEASNSSNMLIKTIEMDQWLEVVPKNNESFVSSVVYCQILKFCSDSFENEDQPLFEPENLNISINFSFVESSGFSNFSKEKGLYCSFLHPDNIKAVNDKTARWENKGNPQILKENANSQYICSNQTQLGFYALLYNKDFGAEETNKSGSSTVLTITLCVVGAVVLGGGVFIIIWLYRKKNVPPITPLEHSLSINKEKDNKAKSSILQPTIKEKEKQSKSTNMNKSKEKPKQSQSKTQSKEKRKGQPKEKNKHKKSEKNKK